MVPLKDTVYINLFPNFWLQYGEWNGAFTKLKFEHDHGHDSAATMWYHGLSTFFGQIKVKRLEY